MLFSNICRASTTAISCQTIASTLPNTYGKFNADFDAYQPTSFAQYSEFEPTIKEGFELTNGYSNFYDRKALETTRKAAQVSASNKRFSDRVSFAIVSAPSNEMFFRMIPNSNGEMVETPSGQEIAAFFKPIVEYGNLSNTNTILPSSEAKQNYTTQVDQKNLTKKFTPLSLLPLFNALPITNKIPSLAIPIAPLNETTENALLDRLLGTDDFGVMIREGDGGASQFEELAQEENLSVINANNNNNNSTIVNRGEKIISQAIKFLSLNRSTF